MWRRADNSWTPQLSSIRPLQKKEERWSCLGGWSELELSCEVNTLVGLLDGLALSIIQLLPQTAFIFSWTALPLHHLTSSVVWVSCCQAHWTCSHFVLVAPECPLAARLLFLHSWISGSRLWGPRSKAQDRIVLLGLSPEAGNTMLQPAPLLQLHHKAYLWHCWGLYQWYWTCTHGAESQCPGMAMYVVSANVSWQRGFWGGGQGRRGGRHSWVRGGQEQPWERSGIDSGTCCRILISHVENLSMTRDAPVSTSKNSWQRLK